MKRIIITIIIFSLFQSIALGEDDDMIWNYRSDDFAAALNDSVKNEYREENQKKLDAKIEQNLNLSLSYTDLEDCINTALSNNFNIKSMSAIKKNKEWMYKNAYTLLAPDFQYSYSLNDYSGEFLVGGILAASFHERAYANNFVVSLPINSALFFGVSIQKKNRNAAVHNLKFTKEETILQTGLAYYDLLERKLELDVLSSNIRDRQEQLRIATARHKIGVGAKFDVTRAEAELAKAEQEYITAYNSIRLYQAKLANLLGIDVITPVYPYEQSISTRQLLAKQYTIEELYEMSTTTREDVKARKQEILAKKAEIKAYWTEFAPYMALQYQKSFVGTTKVGPLGNQTIGLVITAPLGKKLGLETITRIKAEEASLENLNIQLEILRRNIKENIISSYYTSENLLRKIEESKKEIKFADESLRSAIVRLHLGESTFIDVLQAQSIKVQARQTMIAHIAQYNKQQIQLLFDAGIISPESVLNGYVLP